MTVSFSRCFCALEDLNSFTTQRFFEFQLDEKNTERLPQAHTKALVKRDLNFHLFFQIHEIQRQ